MPFEVIIRYKLLSFLIILYYPSRIRSQKCLGSVIPILFLKQNFVDPSFKHQSALFCPASQDTIHALFAPLHYEPGYAYPLIVWLHGQGSDERQLRLIMPLVSMRNYVAVAPRGICMKEMGGDEKEGYGWPNNYEQIPQVEQHIFDAIEAASQKI